MSTEQRETPVVADRGLPDYRSTEASTARHSMRFEELDDATTAYLRRRSPGYKGRLLAMSLSEIEALGGMAWWLQEIDEVRWLEQKGLTR
jgi:hypothetical protein